MLCLSGSQEHLLLTVFILMLGKHSVKEKAGSGDQVSGIRIARLPQEDGVPGVCLGESVFEDVFQVHV